jgi:hypothetical protein
VSALFRAFSTYPTESRHPLHWCGMMLARRNDRFEDADRLMLPMDLRQESPMKVRHEAW